MIRKRKQKKSKLQTLTAAQQVALISSTMGYKTYAQPPQHWLKTGSKRLNTVLGSRRKGLAYGKMITLAGPPSSAKTTIALILAGIAQRDGAEVGWVDVENSFDAGYAKTCGLDPGEPVYAPDGVTAIGYTRIALFRVEYVQVGKDIGKKKKGKKGKGKQKKEKENSGAKLAQEIKSERMETAEELFTRVEGWMKLRKRLAPTGKVYLGVDSTTGIQPAEELAAGLTEQNMRSKISLAPFLNRLLKGWIPFALHTNALIVLIGQLRTNPMQMFGDPNYIPGGNGILFYPSVVVWARRLKKGILMQKGKQVGVVGIMTNKKNKAGGGSVEYKKCGYKIFFNGKPWKFMDADEAHAEV